MNDLMDRLMVIKGHREYAPPVKTEEISDEEYLKSLGLTEAEIERIKSGFEEV